MSVDPAIEKVDGVSGRLQSATHDAMREVYAIVRDAVAAERERCAKLVEEFDDYPIDRDQMERIAEAIRGEE